MLTGRFSLPKPGCRKFQQISNDNALVGSCEAINIPPVVARKGPESRIPALVDHEMVAGQI
jgi:hypothetical protein